jgi:hypothetical protein
VSFSGLTLDFFGADIIVFMLDRMHCVEKERAASREGTHAHPSAAGQRHAVLVLPLPLLLLLLLLLIFALCFERVGLALFLFLFLFLFSLFCASHHSLSILLGLGIGVQRELPIIYSSHFFL